MTFNGVELTEDTILRTREHFAAVDAACIREAKSGEVEIFDLDEYVAWHEKLARKTMAGDWDHTLTFRQHAYYLQTGECVSLLP